MENNVNNALEIKKLEYEMSPAAQQAKQLNVLASQARMFAGSTIVPDTYKGNEGNCAIAVDMAVRMGCNPLMVMQNLYIVHGQPSFSSKFLIAALNSTGRFSPLDYEWKGDAGTDEWSCRANAVRLADGKLLQGSWVSLGMAKKEGWSTKNGSKWLTMPELMLMYRAAAFFQRVYAPEVSMGFITQEEAEELPEPKTIDATYEDVTDKVAADVAAPKVDVEIQEEQADAAPKQERGKRQPGF